MAEENIHKKDAMFGTSARDIASGKWIAVQRRVFTRWANAYLKQKRIAIEDITTDFADGVNLIALLEVLTREPPSFKYKKPTPEKPTLMKLHQLENLKYAFAWMTEKGLKLVNVGANDVHDGNEKIILGLLWSIIALFMVGEINLDGVSGKEGLLLWCQRNTMGYDNVDITDFNKSWSNGLAFCALIHKHRPDVIPYETLTADDPARNLALAFDAAEEYFGITRILDVEDITEAVKPDEKIVLTYVAFFFKGFADFLRRQGLAKSIAKAVDITKRHDAWIEQYNEGATKLKTFLDDNTARYANRSHGSTSAEVKVALDEFYAYKSGEKPTNKAAWANLEGLFQTFASSARNNNRPQYAPAEGLSVADLTAGWTALDEAENAYETDVRSTYDTFLVLENTLAKFDIKIAKLDAWMDAQNEVFASDTYAREGTTLTTVETLLDAYAAYSGQLAHFREVANELYSWLTMERMDEHADQPDRVETYNAAMEKLGTMEAAGVAYEEQLQLCKERCEKFSALNKVDAWMNSKLELFSAQQYGESMDETKQLLEDHAAFAGQAAPMKEVVDTMSSEQEVIMEQVKVHQEKMGTTEEQADIYRQYLELSEEKFAKFAILDKIQSWCDAQRAIFEREDYGDSLSAVAALLEGFSAFQANLAKHKEVLDAMESNQEVINDRIDEVRQLFDSTTEEGAEYKGQLDMCQERLTKLPVLDTIEAWCEPHRATFAKGELGETVAEVSAKIEAFLRYEQDAAVRRKVVADMTTEQPSIQMRLESTGALVQALLEAGAAYHRDLILCEERLIKLPILDSVAAWCDTERALFAGAVYGDSVAESEGLIEAYEQIAAAAVPKKARVAAMSSEQEVITARIAEVTALCQAVDDEGAEYQQQLVLCAERHDKLPRLDAVAVWCEPHAALFEAGALGETIVEVDVQLDTHDAFDGEAVPQKEEVDNMSSEQQVIVDRIGEVGAQVTATLEAGAVYKQALVDQRERLVKLPQLQKVFDWCQEYRGTFAAAEYGESVGEVDKLLRRYATFTGLVVPRKEIVDGMTSALEDISSRITEVSGVVEAAISEGTEYKAQLDDTRERHVKLPLLQKVEDWTQGHRGVFYAAEYGESIDAVDELLDLYTQFEANVVPKKAVADDMASEQEVLLARIQEVRDLVEAALSEGADYKVQLEWSRERLVKLPQLDKIQVWCDSQRELFAEGLFGDTLDDVARLLRTHAAFDVNLAPKQKVADTMDSEQEVITTRVAEVKEVLAATKTEADAYHAQILLSKERLEKLPQLDKIDVWCDKERALFASGDYGETLVAVATLMDTFEIYTINVGNKQSILDEMTSEQEVITTRRDEVRAKMAATEEEATAYSTQLQLSKERLEKLPVLAKVEEWAQGHTALFEAADYGDSLVAVAALQDALDSGYRAQLPSKRELVDGMSSEQDVINTRLGEVKAVLDATAAAEAAYQQGLDDSKAAHQHIVDLIKSYNSKATELVFSIDDLEEELKEPVLSNSIESVQTSTAKYNDSLKATMDALTESYTEIDAWARELMEQDEELQAVAFERYTLNDLYEKYTAVYNNMSTREEELQGLLAEQEAKEALRVEFATLANKVAEYTDKQSAAVGDLTGSLEDQAEALAAMKAEYDASTQITEVEECAARVAEAGVVNNPHTRETIYSLRSTWEVLKDVFDRADESIQAQILAKRDEQITPEQYKEIKEVFEFFDEDGDETLDRTEFHSCATGIGVLLNDEEVTAKMAELDTTGDGRINFKEFTVFMIERLIEPGHTQGDVAKAFQDLADGEDYITPTMMKTTFMDAELKEYLESNMKVSPRTDTVEPESLEYSEFLGWLFSR